MGQYKPELAAHWGAKALSDGTMDVSMVVSVIAALGLGRLISLPFSGSPVRQIRTQIKRNHRRDLLCIILYGNRICSVYGSCLRLCHCRRYRKLLPGHLRKPDMYGDLCKQSFCSEPVYKILHVYQPVSASFPHRICSSGEYVLQNHLYCCRCCDLYRWNPDPVPAIPGEKYSRYSKERKSKIKDHSCSSCSNPHRIYKLFYIHAVAEL